MDIMAIFGTQFVLSVIVFSLIARWYVSPWLASQPVRDGLMILLFPHALRHLGLIFVLPAFVEDQLDNSFANLAAYGDLASGLMALLALVLLRMQLKSAIPLVWLFNIVGTLDLVNALRQAEVVPYLGVSWLVPTFVVPVLLVTHFMIFARLIGQPRRVQAGPKTATRPGREVS